MSTPPTPASALDYAPTPPPGGMPVAIQTGALLLDAYRDINSKKLFWITMILSGLVVAAFSVVGVNATGYSIFGKTFPNAFFNTNLMSASQFYKFLFSTFGIALWLNWIAVILALVSTAPMFPDFLSAGAVDLYLSKPISRLRLFMTKYVAGLLFVGLQVGVFCTASFLVIGLRGGAWVWSLFIAVPLTLLFFSYLWGICALLGVVTRSTISSLLLTLLFWFLMWGIHTAEVALLYFSTAAQVNQVDLQRQIDKGEQRIASLTTRPATTRPGSSEAVQLQMATTALAADKAKLADAHDSVAVWHKGFYLLKLPLPKLSETSALTNRYLTRGLAERPDRDGDDDDATGGKARDGPFNSRWAEQETARRLKAAVTARTPLYLIGTSLAFEAAIVGLAALLFCRRDF